MTKSIWNGVPLGHLDHHEDHVRRAILKHSTPELEREVHQCLENCKKYGDRK